MEFENKFTDLFKKHSVKKVKQGSGDLVTFLQEILSNKISDNAHSILDLAAVLDQYNLWRTHLPRVKIYYAMKASYDRPILDLLHQLKCGFDLASKFEFELLDKYQLDKDLMIYSNPNKQVSHLKAAEERGISKVTVDSVWELEKLKVHFPEAQILVRLKTDGKGTTWNLSARFGCTLEESEEILKKAKELNLNIVGVSFHVGYRTDSTETFTNVLNDSLAFIEKAHLLGYLIKYVDIGGGFPGFDWDCKTKFSELAVAINEGLDSILEKYPDILFLGEPGRFLVCRSGILLIQIIGKKSAGTKTNPTWIYTLNEGKYGMFNGMVKEEPNFKIKHFKRTGIKFISKFYGPTCDSGDLVLECELEELDIGDWVYVIHTGSYLKTCSSQFNGFFEREETIIWREDSLLGDSYQNLS